MKSLYSCSAFLVPRVGDGQLRPHHVLRIRIGIKQRLQIQPGDVVMAALGLRHCLIVKLLVGQLRVLADERVKLLLALHRGACVLALLYLVILVCLGLLLGADREADGLLRVSLRVGGNRRVPRNAGVRVRGRRGLLRCVLGMQGGRSGQQKGDRCSGQKAGLHAGEKAAILHVHPNSIRSSGGAVVSRLYSIWPVPFGAWLALARQRRRGRRVRNPGRSLRLFRGQRWPSLQPASPLLLRRHSPPYRERCRRRLRSEN
jgi:hypothetical protein